MSQKIKLTVLSSTPIQFGHQTDIIHAVRAQVMRGSGIIPVNTPDMPKMIFYVDSENARSFRQGAEIDLEFGVVKEGVVSSDPKAKEVAHKLWGELCTVDKELIDAELKVVAFKKRRRVLQGMKALNDAQVDEKKVVSDELVYYEAKVVELGNFRKELLTRFPEGHLPDGEVRPEKKKKAKV